MHAVLDQLHKLASGPRRSKDLALVGMQDEIEKSLMTIQRLRTGLGVGRVSATVKELKKGTSFRSRRNKTRSRFHTLRRLHVADLCKLLLPLVRQPREVQQERFSFDQKTMHNGRRRFRLGFLGQNWDRNLEQVLEGGDPHLVAPS